MKPPQILLDLLPKAVADWLSGWGWFAILGVLGLIVLAIVWSIVGRLFARRPAPLEEGGKLLEHLGDYPPPPGGALVRRLTVEGTPVRVRLVVLAPVGAGEVRVDEAEALLNRVAPELGEVVLQDKPRVRVWPRQLSVSGFAQLFFTNAVTPEGDGEQSPWILVAGRAKIGQRAVMVGLALLASKPSPIGTKSLDVGDWGVLRVRVRDS